MEGGRNRIPDAGEQIHDEKDTQRTGKVAQKLLQHRSLAPECHIPLQREVNALTNDDGCKIGKREGQSPVLKAVAAAVNLDAVGIIRCKILGIDYFLNIAYFSYCRVGCRVMITA